MKEDRISRPSKGKKKQVAPATRNTSSNQSATSNQISPAEKTQEVNKDEPLEELRRRANLLVDLLRPGSESHQRPFAPKVIIANEIKCLILAAYTYCPKEIALHLGEISPVKPRS